LIIRCCYFKKQEEEALERDLERAGGAAFMHIRSAHNFSKFCAYPPYGRPTLMNSFPGPCCIGPTGKLHAKMVLEAVAEEGKLESLSLSGTEATATQTTESTKDCESTENPPSSSDGVKETTEGADDVTGSEIVVPLTTSSPETTTEGNKKMEEERTTTTESSKSDSCLAPDDDKSEGHEGHEGEMCHPLSASQTNNTESIKESIRLERKQELLSSSSSVPMVSSSPPLPPPPALLLEEAIEAVKQDSRHESNQEMV